MSFSGFKITHHGNPLDRHVFDRLPSLRSTTPPEIFHVVWKSAVRWTGIEVRHDATQRSSGTWWIYFSHHLTVSQTFGQKELSFFLSNEPPLESRDVYINQVCSGVFQFLSPPLGPGTSRLYWGALSQRSPNVKDIPFAFFFLPDMIILLRVNLWTAAVDITNKSVRAARFSNHRGSFTFLSNGS